MTNSNPSDQTLLPALSALALKAGAKALEIYGTDFKADAKADASPVTEADRLGEEIILAGLREIAPEIPVLAEESASEGKVPALGNVFFLVDPLDGTREFINKTGEFTVNIALIREGAAALGVVYAPAANKLYEGAAGAGAWLSMIDRRPQRARTRPRRRRKPVAPLARDRRFSENSQCRRLRGGGLIAQILPHRGRRC